VVDGVTGLLVPLNSPLHLAEATLRILEAPDLARSMGRAGRTRVERHFSVEHAADDYLQAYADLIEGRW
jgi:glycosyltransferase involved in cell wall biosynthesis